MQKEHSSFRDRSGFVFYKDDTIYRAVHKSYQDRYDFFLSSGLYDLLVKQEKLIPHADLPPGQWPEEFSKDEAEQQIYKILQPEKIPYISYPYEWCFQQLKEAALLTLEIQLKALEYNMTLKDASAFNIQFQNGKPVFIDTLSFDNYKEGDPWIAYRQFCCHFLAPLAIMRYVTTDLHRLSQVFIDGIPLAVASNLLPFKTRLSPFYLLHIHYHAKLEAKYSGDIEASDKVKRHLSKTKLVAVINHLVSGIRSIKLPSKKSEWIDYYNEFSYSNEAIENKKQLVKKWTLTLKPKIVWDLGCNTGMFSELVQAFCGQIISFDIDPFAIEKFYAVIKRKGYKNILPLVLDLNNPSAAIGWANQERKSFVERGKADLILALALIHHLSISNNVPLNDVAELMNRLTTWLIIEFVPKHDKQVQRLLVTREDIFTDYNQENFEKSFQNFFAIENKQEITGTERTVYLMKRK
jgi:ribosomal protein L11 methylase PrmA